MVLRERGSTRENHGCFACGSLFVHHKQIEEKYNTMKYRASWMPTVAGAFASITKTASYHYSRLKVAPLAGVYIVFIAINPSAQAALTFSAGYSSALFFTHSNSDTINSYDWGSDSNLYYATAAEDFTSGGVYRNDGNSSTTIRAASADYAGASVVAINSSVYFNDGNYPSSKIYRYNIDDSTTTSTVATNYLLSKRGNSLVTTGSADFSTTQISYYAGGVLSGYLDIGAVAGGSGPCAFDAEGNMFYAPGYGDSSIYRWSTIEVAAALLGSSSSQLDAAGHQWIDYSGSFAGAGASSLLIDANGNVLVTLTDFVNPSALVKFDASGNGNYETVLTSTDRLGELRMHEGALLISDANRIITIIPEPSTMLVTLSGLLLLMRRKR